MVKEFYIEVESCNANCPVCYKRDKFPDKRFPQSIIPENKDFKKAFALVFEKYCNDNTSIILTGGEISLYPSVISSVAEFLMSSGKSNHLSLVTNAKNINGLTMLLMPSVMNRINSICVSYSYTRCPRKQDLDALCKQVESLTSSYWLEDFSINYTFDDPRKFFSIPSMVTKIVKNLKMLLGSVKNAKKCISIEPISGKIPGMSYVKYYEYYDKFLARLYKQYPELRETVVNFSTLKVLMKTNVYPGKRCDALVLNATTLKLSKCIEDEEYIPDQNFLNTDKCLLCPDRKFCLAVCPKIKSSVEECLLSRETIREITSE